MKLYLIATIFDIRMITSLLNMKDKLLEGDTPSNQIIKKKINTSESR